MSSLCVAARLMGAIQPVILAVWRSIAGIEGPRPPKILCERLEPRQLLTTAIDIVGSGTGSAANEHFVV